MCFGVLHSGYVHRNGPCLVPTGELLLAGVRPSEDGVGYAAVVWAVGAISVVVLSTLCISGLVQSGTVCVPVISRLGSAAGRS